MEGERKERWECVNMDLLKCSVQISGERRIRLLDHHALLNPIRRQLSLSCLDYFQFMELF